MRLAFDNAYEGTPSWETGRPQPVVERLVASGAFGPAWSSVLDAGCGTGRHAVLLARAGLRVTGVDVARRAVELARERAAEACADARFVVADAFDLGSIGEGIGAPFDAALDVGLFHVLQPADAPRYAEALASVVRPGGRAFVVAWSDRNPFGYGPERVTRRALRAAFTRATGWRVASIVPERLESRLPPGEVHAWLATLERR